MQHLLLLAIETDSGLRDIWMRIESHTTAEDAAVAMSTFLHMPRTETTRTVERVSRGRAVFEPSARVASVDLRDGDVVRLSDAGDASESEIAAVAEVQISTPIGKVESTRLQFGDYLVGRAPDCDIPLADRLASRRHARLTIGDVYSLTDLGSTNGTHSGGRRVGRDHVIPENAEIAIGDTTLAIRNLAVHGSAPTTTQRFSRPPRPAVEAPPREVMLPTEPSAPPKRRIPWLSALFPVTTGVILSIGLLNPEFVLFGLLGLVMIVALWAAEEFRWRPQFRAAMNEFESELGAATEAYRQAVESEASALEFRSPAARAVCDEVERLGSRMWERRLDDPDFLEVRLGTAVRRASCELVSSDDSPAQTKRIGEVIAAVGPIGSAPHTISLTSAGVVGIAGAADDRSGFLSSLLVQVAGSHGPSDLAIAVITGEDGRSAWEWLKWLPHVSRGKDVLGTSSLAYGAESALGLLNSIASLLERRSKLRAANSGGFRPHILCVIDDSIPLDHGRFGELMSRGPELGFSFLWVSATVSHLPEGCKNVVEVLDGGLAGRVWRPNEDATSLPELEQVEEGAARRVAMRLAGVQDTALEGASSRSLPTSTSLVSVLGDETLLVSPDNIVDRWAESLGSLTLKCPIGVSDGGVLALDLSVDGPHALVGGTTGAGKSEFLQTFLTSLALTYRPNRATFLLVDYKGGSAFGNLSELPHCVGLVTDLDPSLARRALAALRAELHRRELILYEHRAKDLVSLLRQDPDSAPPSLVIVVDELASLVRELPVFIEGLVDIAQRGRSLGLHLILATQRPAGVVTNQIRANTNLRVALRTASEEESNDLIDSPTAALIDRRTPGRAVARLGPSELVEFQSAYVGGRSSVASESSPDVGDFEFGQSPFDSAQVAHFSLAAGETDLARLVRLVGEAFEATTDELPRRPWVEPLDAQYDLLALQELADGIVFGVRDASERQTHDLAVFEPEVDNGMLIIGSAGSGRTTALRTIAASAGIAREPVEVHAIDYSGRGLSMIEALPHVGSVVVAGEEDQLVGLLRMLSDTVEGRMAEFARTNSSTLSEFRQSGSDTQCPRVMLLVNGFENLRDTLQTLERGRWLEALDQLAVDGWRVGVHMVLAASRGLAFGPLIRSTFGRRLILRLTDQDEFRALGADPAMMGEYVPPGRAIDGDHLIQVAVVGSGESAAQHTAMSSLAARLERDGVEDVEPVWVLPPLLKLSDLERSSPERLVVGQHEDRAPLTLSVPGAYGIAGPDRSGKSTALESCAVAAVQAGLSCLLLSSRRSDSSLDGLARGVTIVDGEEAFIQLLRDSRPDVFLVDDADLTLRSQAAAAELERVMESRFATVVLAAAPRSWRGFESHFRFVRDRGALMVLHPDPELDGDLLAGRILRTPRLWLPGRGVRRIDRELTTFQFALADKLAVADAQ